MTSMRTTIVSPIRTTRTSDCCIIIANVPHISFPQATQYSSQSPISSNHCRRVQLSQNGGWWQINFTQHYFVYQLACNFILQQFQVGSQSMSIASSPFLSDMQQCRQAMRKLRKKIYKNCRLTQSTAKKLKDNTEEIIAIFRSRHVPEFINVALKKRRNFDLKSIKNISVPTLISLEQIQNKTQQQQQEVQELFRQHKQRMLQAEKREEENRVFGEVIYQLSTQNLYSSTNQDDQVIQIDRQQDQSQSEPLQALKLFHGSYQDQQEAESIAKGYFQFNINESSLHQDLGFLNF